jgi:hypothetical protein
MSTVPAAALTAALLVSKGSAHPSRGLARPIRERISFATHDDALPPPGGAQSLRAIYVPQMKAAGPGSKRISVRLDAQQRLRLRLASAHLGKSRQVILLEAIDHYFKHVVPGLLRNPCPCLTQGITSGRDCCERAADR